MVLGKGANAMINVLILVILLVVSWPAGVLADILELKNGQKLEGQFAGGSKEEVRFQVGSQTLKFPIAEVSKITIGTAAQDDFRRAAKEALRQLKALASVTEGGTTYQNYSARVEDAKVKIDQFLDEFKPSPLPRFNEYVSDTVGFYIAASSAWNLKISGGRSPEAYLAQLAIKNELMQKYVPRCAPLQEEILRHRKDSKYSNDSSEFATLQLYGLQLLWGCARNSLIDAEKALGR